MNEKKYIYTIEREKAKCFINAALKYDFEILDCDSTEIMRRDDESLVKFYKNLKAIIGTVGVTEALLVGRTYELITLWKVNDDGDCEELDHFVCEIGSF